MIERTFQDIPKGQLYKTDRQSFPVNRHWSRGTTWTDLLRSWRVLIISEAGAGKTFECGEQAKRLWDAGEPAFFIELSSLALGDLLLDGEEEARLNAWRVSQSDVATFFLDSIDELRLTLGTFEQALKRLNRVIGSHLRRARIVITTRPIPVDLQLVRRLLPIPAPPAAEPKEESFAKTAMGDHRSPQLEAKGDAAAPDWRTVELIPLADEQVAEFAKGQGVEDAAAFVDAQEFTQRPQDLIELCADWREHKRIRTHRERVATNVFTKLRPRDDRPEPAELSVDKAIEGASQLALAMLVMRRTTIRHSAASDDIQDQVALDPESILSDWKLNERRALLERPLFIFASYGRVRFHHRSVAEYLAAERLLALRRRGMPIRALKRLLFAQAHDMTIARPSRRPVAGWLALAEGLVFEILRDYEPAVLIEEGDPESLTPWQRNQVLRAYVERYGRGGWRGSSVPSIQIHRFASPELADDISQLWRGGIENPDIRQTLLDLIAAGPIRDCANIAHEIARDVDAPEVERLIAVNTMVAIGDAKLKDIASEIAAPGPNWPDSIAGYVVLRLFPQDLTVDQLCQALNWIQQATDRAGSLSWELPRLIATVELDPRSLEALRDGLVQLLSAGLRWREEWPHVTCDRTHLSDALAATCVRGLEGSASYDWLHASVLSLRLNHRESSEGKTKRLLRERLMNLSANENTRLFWAEDSLIQSLHAVADPWDRYAEITLHDGPVKLSAERDLAWVTTALGETTRPENERALLLEAAMRLPPNREQWRDHVSGLKPQVADRPRLVAVIDERLKPMKRDNESERREQALAERQEEQEQEHAQNKASWIRFWREVAERPENAFSTEQSWNTAWNLWRAMSQDGEDSRDSGWNRRFIEDHFAKETANRLRRVLMKVWREERPTLPSERPENKRNTYFTRWQLGLAAIYAEAEDPSWAIELTEEEAKLAVRYVPIKTNEVPGWIETLVDVHPTAVDEILGKELSWELKRDPRAHDRSLLLQHISYASQSVVRLFLPRLREWLDREGVVVVEATDDVEAAERLRQVINVMLTHGDEDTCAHLLAVARDRLQHDLPKQSALIWMSTIFQTDAALGVSALEHRIQSVEPAARSEAVEWLGMLFGSRNRTINLKAPTLTPQLLLRLLRLAYRQVRVVDDAEHHGTYTPDIRDNAESARNEILTALLEAEGEDGWAAKLEIAGDPLCAHFKDRILAVAEEHGAQEIDSVAFDEKQAIALDRTYEAPASTNEGMFAIMRDRLTDLDELLLRDTSPREAWEGISNETVLRREIARELRHSANGLYTVDQEAVTADEKETDIRLRSVASDREAIIELKRADGRSGRDLRDTIFDQLVKKYMWAENSRSGCLLVTLAEDRKWKHPDTGTLISVPELMSLLRDEAQRVEENLGREAALAVHLLDLRPRLSPE